jgi:hypothetical protein
MKIVTYASLLALSLAVGTTAASAQDKAASKYDMSKVQAYAESVAKDLVSDADILAAIKKSTAENKKLTFDEVQVNDLSWQLARANEKSDDEAKAKQKKLADKLNGIDGKSAEEHSKLGEKEIKEIRGSATSKTLQAAMKKAPNGAVTEIFVMDGWGWNVGQTGGTSDFYQGDEAKWQKPFTGNVDVSDPEEDDGVMASQVSMPVKDGDKIVGAITVGVNVDKVK